MKLLCYYNNKEIQHTCTSVRSVLKKVYYNRKGFYSVNVQAVVDHNLLFTDLYIGWPGSVHDARVLVNSALYSRCSSKEC